MSRIIGRATFLMTTATGGGIQMRIKNQANNMA